MTVLSPAAADAKRDVAAAAPRRELLYGAAFIAALSGVAYELVLASYATFLLGATIFQYSLVMSLMMASMGLGALVVGLRGWRRRFGTEGTFLAVELALALLASVALPVLYVVFAYALPARLVVGLFVVGFGALIGMEIPLVAEASGPARDSARQFSRILFFDYLGGFIGGILFPLLLVPRLGLFRVAALLGVLNAAVALVLWPSFRGRLGRHAPHWAAATVAVAVVATAALVTAEPLRRWLELRLFDIRIP